MQWSSYVRRNVFLLCIVKPITTYQDLYDNWLVVCLAFDVVCYVVYGCRPPFPNEIPMPVSEDSSQSYQKSQKRAAIDMSAIVYVRMHQLLITASSLAKGGW